MAKSGNKRAAQGSGTIRKKTVVRNGKKYEYWEARLSVGRDPGTGKQIQRSITAKTQKECQAKMTALLNEVNKGTYQTPDKITVEGWLKEWSETYVAGRLKPYTISGYNAVIQRHINPALGSVQLQAVRGTHLQRLYNKMIEQGLSPKTVRLVAAVLHKSFSVAVRQGILPFNPCDHADVPPLKQHEIKPLTDAEISLFLKAIEGDPLCCAFAVCLLAGLREGELLGLSWGQVDFASEEIVINQQLQREKVKGGKSYIAPFTKSSKPRTIKPPTLTFDYLRREKRKQAENKLRAGKLWNNPDDLVFTNELGGNVSIENFYRHFKRLAASIGRPDARPHDLRHTAATVAIASGADVKSVQSMLGHSNAGFTLNQYVHTSERMMEDTAARVQGYYENLEKRA